MALDAAQAVLAFVAGILGFLSPCALPLLPSYVVYYLNLDEETSPEHRWLGIFTFVSATMAGFMTVFASLGFLPSVAIRLMPISSSVLNPVIGVILIAVGFLHLLSDLFSRFFHIGIVPPRASGLISFYIYGVAYALASLSCSFPVFILVVLQSSMVGGPIDSLVLFVLYSLGAGAVMAPVTVTVYMTKKYLHGRLTMIIAHVRKLSAAILIASGAYILLSSIVK